MEHIANDQLRDLILDFYTIHDPQRLSGDIDIAGIVRWTQQHGIEKLNDVLQRQYGRGLDLNKRLNTQEVFKRYTVSIDKVKMQETLRQHEELKEKLVEFYSHYDNSKLAGIDKLVKFAITHGDFVLNQKLFMKYKDDLSIMKFKQEHSFGARYDEQMPKEPLKPHQQFHLEQQQRQAGGQNNNQGNQFGQPEQTYSRPVSGNMSTDTPQLKYKPGYPAEPDDADVSDREYIDDDGDYWEEEPPPPPEEDYQELARMESEVRRFYALVDKSKLDVFDALLDWALKLGREEFNKKLTGLYDYNLEDLDFLEDQHQNASKKPPANNISTPAHSNTHSRNHNETNTNANGSSHQSAQNRYMDERPPPPNTGFKPPKPTHVPHTPAIPAPRPVPSFNQPPKPTHVPHTPAMPAPREIPSFNQPPRSMQIPNQPALSQQFTQMHNTYRPPVPAKTQMHTQSSTHSLAQVSVRSYHDPDPAPKEVAAEACNNYRLDMTGKSFGDCVCGHSKADHLKRKPKMSANKATKVNQSVRAHKQSFESIGSFMSAGQSKPPPPMAPHPSNRAQSAVGGKPPPPSQPRNTNAKPAPPSAPHPNQRAGSYQEVSGGVINSSRAKGVACDNYRLDMTGSTFGVCVCGFDRAHHKKPAAKPAKMFL